MQIRWPKPELLGLTEGSGAFCAYLALQNKPVTREPVFAGKVCAEANRLRKLYKKPGMMTDSLTRYLRSGTPGFRDELYHRAGLNLCVGAGHDGANRTVKLREFEGRLKKGEVAVEVKL
jgi:hypothetical protein